MFRGTHLKNRFSNSHIIVTKRKLYYFILFFRFFKLKFNISTFIPKNKFYKLKCIIMLSIYLKIYEKKKITSILGQKNYNYKLINIILPCKSQANYTRISRKCNSQFHSSLVEQFSAN